MHRGSVASRNGVHAICTAEIAIYLRDVAFAEARRIDLNQDDAHDCASEMVLRALTQAAQAAGYAAVVIADADEGAKAAPLSTASLSTLITNLVLRADLCPDQTAKWLRRCARNFALNYHRRIRAIHRHETNLQTDDSVATKENLPSMPTAPPAEYDALNRLLQQDVFAAMGQLPPPTRDAFARFHIDGDGLAEIALSSGKSQNAVKKQMHRLRHHVRTALVQQGHGPEGYASDPADPMNEERAKIT